MSFNINRTNNKINKKNISINSSINSNNLKDSIGSTGVTTIANVNTLSLNGSQISVTATQMNLTKIAVNGSAEASKVLITDSSNNINNINSISCDTLIANGQNITASTFQTSSSDDSNNSYLTNIDDGIASASKSLITDKKNSINNINILSTKNININNININTVQNKSNSLVLKNYENLYPNIHSLNTTFQSSTYSRTLYPNTTNGSSLFNEYYWSSICYSSELSLFVAVSRGSMSTVTPTIRVVTTKDGQNWNLQTSIDNSWEDVIWISKLKLFVAVSSTGVGNQIMTSPNGITWTSRVTPTTGTTFKSIVWSNELNLCVAINTATNSIIISNDCINWSLAYTDLPIGLNNICWSPELSLFVATSSVQDSSYYRIFISSDGTNWNSISYLSTAFFSAICWSPYYKMFIISRLSTDNIYSYDGYNWSTGSTDSNRIDALIWIDELKLFCGFNDTGNIRYSKTGISNWSGYIVDSQTTATVGKIAWSPELGIIIISMKSHSSIGRRFHTITPPYIGNKPSFLAPANYLYQDKVNGRFGFNTSQPNVPVEINATNGNVLKLTSNSSTTQYATFDILSNGQLNLTTSYFKLLTNYSTYGLKLNNILLTTQISSLNNLGNIISGTAKALNPLITDSNNNISNLNIVKCNSLSINGSNVDASTNNNYFIDSVIGSSTPIKSMIPDENININNINTLNTKLCKINNNLIVNKNINTTHNLTNYNKQINKPNVELYNNIFNNFKTIPVNSANFTSVIWVEELGMFIAIMSGNATNTNRITTSYDGINWTNNINSFNIITGVSFTCLTWSPELKLLIAMNNTFAFNRIMMSSDGFNWYQHYNTTINFRFVSSCWSPELSLFAAVSSDGGTGKIITSSSGYGWAISKSVNVDFIKVIWANKLNLFVAITNNITTPIYISNDGIDWTTTGIQISNVTVNCKSICWSEELNMLYAISASDTFAYYSYDGYNWLQILLPFNTGTVSNIEWISDLNIFIMSPANTQKLAYSDDGYNWYTSTQTFATINNFAWSPDLKKLVMLATSGANGYISNTIFPTNSLNTVVSQSNNLIINKSNGNMGIGLNPNYQLELSTDSAAKATSATWTIGSDIRLKEEIELANLDTCYNNFKNINLVRYKWKDDIYDNESINDRSQLGWIAQDIELIFPKSITIKNKFNISDCKCLNTDQLLSTLYGTVQKLITNYENQDIELENLDTEMTTINTFLTNLEIVP